MNRPWQSLETLTNTPLGKGAREGVGGWRKGDIEEEGAKRGTEERRKRRIGRMDGRRYRGKGWKKGMEERRRGIISGR